MNRDAKTIFSHGSNGVFVSFLEGVDRRTGAMPHCWNIKELDSNNNSYPSSDEIESSGISSWISS